MSVSDIIIEMSDTEALLNSAAIGVDVKSNLVAALASKVKNLAVASAGAIVPLAQALDASTMQEDLKQVLKKAIEARITSGLQAAPAAHGHAGKQQLLHNWNAYMTAGDWAALTAPGTNALAMVATMVNRGLLLGLRNLHEQTVRGAVALVLHHHLAQTGGQFPRHSEIHSWVLRFKQALDAAKTPYQHAHLLRYPNEPSQLPGHMFNTAYADVMEPPVPKVIPGLEDLAAHVPLRKNSSLLQKEQQRFVGPSASAGGFHHLG